MKNKLFVGGISWDSNEDQLKELFEQVGEVLSATIIRHRDTGKSKGFGFVEMATDELAVEAIEKLNGQELEGRKLTVNEAKPKAPRDDNRNYSSVDNDR